MCLATVNINLQAEDNASNVINRLNATLKHTEMLGKSLGKSIRKEFVGMPNFIFPAGRPAPVNMRQLEFFTNRMEQMNAAAGDPLKGIEMLEYERRERAKLMDVLDKNRMKLLFFGLGVMFAGMAIERAMKGFLKPAQDAVGISEIFGATLELLFLPAMLAILPVFLWLLDVVNKIPDELKLGIGLLAMAVLGIGMIMATFGQAVTLISSISQAGEAMEGLNAFIELLKTGEIAGKISDMTSKLQTFMNTPIGFAVTLATLAVTTLEVGSIIWKQNEEQIAKKYPEFYAAKEGAVAIAQNLAPGPIGKTIGWGVEGLFGLSYAIGEALFSEKGLLHDSIVNLLADPLSGMQNYGMSGGNPIMYVYLNTAMNTNVNAKGVMANSQIEQAVATGGS